MFSMYHDAFPPVLVIADCNQCQRVAPVLRTARAPDKRAARLSAADMAWYFLVIVCSRNGIAADYETSSRRVGPRTACIIARLCSAWDARRDKVKMKVKVSA